jgi:succinate dehydrogenase (ubiquinone) membrane anchor subunit
MWALKGATVLVLAGLYEFETNDVGITEGVYLPFPFEQGRF